MFLNQAEKKKEWEHGWTRIGECVSPRTGIPLIEHLADPRRMWMVAFASPPDNSGSNFNQITSVTRCFPRTETFLIVELSHFDARIKQGSFNGPLHLLIENYPTLHFRCVSSFFFSKTGIFYYSFLNKVLNFAVSPFSFLFNWIFPEFFHRNK